MCAINPGTRGLRTALPDKMTGEPASRAPEAVVEGASEINSDARGSKFALMDKILFVKANRCHATVPGRENQGVSEVRPLKCGGDALIFKNLFGPKQRRNKILNVLPIEW